MPLRLVGTLALLVIVGALATGGGADAANQTVMALPGPNRFAPNDVTVNQHETVTWTNGGGTHNVQFTSGPAYEQPSSPSNSSWTVSRTFDTAGTFTYICREHGSAMSGVVHVVAPPPGGGPPAPEPGGGGSPGPGSGGPPQGGQPPPDQPQGDAGGGALKVTLKLSDASPLAGRPVRLFGVVKPARDGRRLQIQRRVGAGRFKTIATTRLHAARGDKSTYSLKLRLAKDATLRARVGSGFSAARKLDVHRAA
jgi:plastocyanin